MNLDVASVFGTYNRLPSLQRCIDSIRYAAGKLNYVNLIADGGSTDGTREWLEKQSDCELLEGGLRGSTVAFNVGFSRAVDLEARFVNVFNDDIHFVGEKKALEEGVAIFDAHPEVGTIGWSSDRYGEWRFEKYLGVVYMTQGFVRREVGMAVARAQGDPTGKAWWDRSLFGYGADTNFGLWVKRLGWEIYEAHDLKVHDSYQEDGQHTNFLRNFNNQNFTNGNEFEARWGKPVDCRYRRADAERFGGRLL